MSMQTAPVVEIESVVPFRVVGEEIRSLLRGQFEVFEARGPKDTGPPPHLHPWDEAYVVLEGELAVQRGEAEFPVGVGNTILIPAMDLHCYRVMTDSARWLVITSPAGAADFFADVDVTTQGTMDLPGIQAAASRHEVDIPLFH